MFSWPAAPTTQNLKQHGQSLEANHGHTIPDGHDDLAPGSLSLHLPRQLKDSISGTMFVEAHSKLTGSTRRKVNSMLPNPNVAAVKPCNVGTHHC